MVLSLSSIHGDNLLDTGSVPCQDESPTELMVSSSVNHTVTVPSAVLGSVPGQSLGGAHLNQYYYWYGFHDSSTCHVEGATESMISMVDGGPATVTTVPCNV